MLRRFPLSLLAAIIGVSIPTTLAGQGGETPMRPAIPAGLDLYMPIPDANPMTASKIALGRRLFSDRRLSRDQSVSCRSCHDPDRAFSVNRTIAPGVFGRTGRRNAPALVNRGYGRSFFWDGRTATLEEQVLQPIEDPNEMDLSLAEASRRVGLPMTEISHALATYVRSLFSGDAPFDRFIAGDADALSPTAQQGLRLFRGKAGCTTCHVGPTFTDERFHNTGIAWRGSDSTTGAFSDDGRSGVTNNASDRGAFRTPTLREIARTAPYMHDGSLATLNEVVEFYSRGGRPNPLLDPLLRPLNLSELEKNQLVVFLRSLSGKMTR